jgi:hypothetical protein
MAGNDWPNAAFLKQDSKWRPCDKIAQLLTAQLAKKMNVGMGFQPQLDL